MKNIPILFIQRCAVFLIFFSLNAQQQPPAPPQPPPNTIQPAQTPQQDLEPKQQNPFDTTITSTIVEGKNDFKVGSSIPLSGEMAILGGQINDGMNLMFNKLKQELKLPFIYNLNTLDDKADVKTTKQNIKKIATQTPLLLGLLGTNTVAAVNKTLLKHNAVGIFPIDGSTDHRKEEFKNLVFFRASYKEEIYALVRYATNILNKKRFAIFYEASEWGDNVLTILKEVLAEYKVPLVGQASYPEGTLLITKAAEKIIANDPNAILCVAGARPGYNFIQYVLNKGLHKTVILGLSNLQSIQMTLQRSRGAKIVTTAVVPDPEKSKLPIVEEYRADMKKYSPNKTLSPISLESYINAALLVECTKLVALPLTVNKLLGVIEGLKNINFKGLALNFYDRSLSHDIWLNDGQEGEWIKAEITTSKKKIQKPPTPKQVKS